MPGENGLVGTRIPQLDRLQYLHGAAAADDGVVSSPIKGQTANFSMGRLAQRESIGLTSRGSQVQILYRPPVETIEWAVELARFWYFEDF
jgi:hypothetical protein